MDCMKESDLISVVVPVYNAEEYINRCIDSILIQTYEKFELIIVDDGSSDDSVHIIEEYVQGDERIKLLRQENAGPDIARGRGVKVARGKYITFVDADDYVEPIMIEELYHKMMQNDCDIVTSHVIRFNDLGKKWSTDVKVVEDILCESVNESMFQYFVTRSITGAYYGKLYKAELFDGYEFIKEAVIGEDVSGVLNALSRANKVLITSGTYYNYYWNTDSISHSGYTKRHLVSLRNYIKLRDSLVANDYIEERYIVGYFAEFEMAVATAMARAKFRDKVAIQLLCDDLSPRWKLIKDNSSTALYMKLCIKLYLTCPLLFHLLYRVLYLMTGR